MIVLHVHVCATNDNQGLHGGKHEMLVLGKPLQNPMSVMTCLFIITDIMITIVKYGTTTYHMLWCAIRHLKYSQVTGFIGSRWHD